MATYNERRARKSALPAAMLLGLCTTSTAFFAPGVSLARRSSHLFNQNLVSRSAYPTTRLLATLEEAPPMVSTPTMESSESSSPPAMEDPATQFEVQVTKPLAEIKEGDMLEGTVDNIVDYGAFVDVGAEINGLVHVSQISNEFVTDPHTVVSLGQSVTVKVVAVNQETRKLVLTMRTQERAAPREQKDVSKYAELFEQNKDAVYDVAVRNVVQYGVFVEMEEDITGFCHITQMRDASGGRVKSLDEVVKIGDPMKVKIRGVDTKLRRINLTSLLQEETATRGEKKDCALLADYDRDVPHKATVSAVIDYGAFLDLDGVEGLLHISKLREGQVDASELNQLTVGQEVDAYILNIDTTKQQVSFGLYKPTPGPSEGDYEKILEIPRDQFIDGTVVSIMDYGAFVHIGNGVDGMVHISELREGRPGPETVGEVVAVGDEVKVRVMEVNVRNKRVRLSMRQPQQQREQQPRGRSSNNAAPWADFPADQWIEGEVVRVADFGAFIRIADDCDALCHISQLSDDRVETVGDYVQIGQKVQVRVLEVNVDAERVGVSMRAPYQPRGGGGGGRSRERKDVSAFAQYDENEFFEGTIRSTTNFGAFVDIGNGVDGLVHISQISDERVEYVEDVLSAGDVVQVRVIDVNEDAGTVGLSMKAPRGNYGGGGGYGGGQGGYQQDYAQDGGEGYQQEKRSRPRKQQQPRASMDSDDAPAGGKEDWRNYLDNYVTEKSASLSEKYKMMDEEDVEVVEEEDDDVVVDEVDSSDYRIE